MPSPFPRIGVRSQSQPFAELPEIPGEYIGYGLIYALDHAVSEGMPRSSIESAQNGPFSLPWRLNGALSLKVLLLLSCFNLIL
jgi:hypothetical protein